MATSKTNAEKVERDLQALQRNHVSHTDGFNARITSLSTALTSANAEITKLQTLNTKLEQRYHKEIRAAGETVEMLQNVMFKAATKVIDKGKNFRRSSRVRLANWEMESDPVDVEVGEDGAPMTPVSVVRFASPEDDGMGVEGDGSSVTAVDDAEGGESGSESAGEVWRWGGGGGGRGVC